MASKPSRTNAYRKCRTALRSTVFTFAICAWISCQTVSGFAFQESKPSSDATNSNAELPQDTPRAKPLQDSTAAEELQHTPEEIRATVLRLNSPLYSERQSAEELLIRMGGQSIEALKEVQNSGVTELRLRSRRILKLIQRAVYESRLDSFLHSKNPKDDFQLAGWSQFREVVGDETSAKRLFVEMHRENRSLLSRIAEPGRALEIQVRKRAATLQPANIADIASVLLADTVLNSGEKKPDASLAVQSGKFALTIASDATATNINASQYQQELKRLLTGWANSLAVESPENQKATLQVATKYELEGLVDKTAELLTHEHFSGAVLGKAVKYISQQGNQSHIKRIELLLDRSMTINHYNVNPDGSNEPGGQQVQIKVELRDVALASAIYLAGAKYADYGLEFLVEQNPPTINRAGFTSNEIREASIKRWQEFRQTDEGKAIVDDNANKTVNESAIPKK